MPMIDNATLKSMLASGDPQFWNHLSARSLQANSFVDLHSLSTLRRRAEAMPNFKKADYQSSIKLAIIGGYSLQPLAELVQQMLFAHGIEATLWTGEYDNYIWEITDSKSGLHEFAPEMVLLIPPVHRYKYSGELSDAKELIERDLATKRTELLELCRTIKERCKAETLLCNFITPSLHDLGTFRTRTLASEWNFLRMLNIELGLNAPNCVHICDLEFLASRSGGLFAKDDRSWFESKQPFSADFTCKAAKEIAQIVSSTLTPPKKVLVLDLDGTIWGGIIGEDGTEGIELGNTSARAESFKAFQSAIIELYKRGILLAVCSKNDPEKALEPFEKHPEMILHKEHIACFKANWNPKSDNVIAIAKELNLGLDSFVFIDNDPAEIDIMQKFAPAVTSILLGPDPSTYVAVLKDSRLFEPRQITQEDSTRGTQYKQEKERTKLQSSVADMDTFLESLEMQAVISDFQPVDIPRISQLINKSNQFNLTTRRRTETEVADLIGSSNICLALRLKDKFGDLGLVSVVIATPLSTTELIIDTWLMSCRVFKRRVEHLLMTEFVHRAANRGFTRIKGHYLPSAKNQIVKDFYPEMQFKPLSSNSDRAEYELDPRDFKPFITKIS